MATRTSLARIWASSNAASKTPILDAKYDLGWVAEIPTFQNLNWLHNKLDNNQLALAERGVFEWGPDVVYKKGALAWRETDGFIYICLVAGTAEAPSATASNWKRSAVQVSRVEFDALVVNWNAHLVNKQNPHGTTAEQVGAYTKVEIDQRAALLQSNLDAHANDKQNPHGTTALLAGAVPATGGVYTGEVSFPSLRVGTDTKIISNATLFEMSYKTSSIGINAAGRPFSRLGAVSSNLLLETDYEAQRLLLEPSFGVPLPSFSLAAQTHLFPSDGNTDTEVRFTRSSTFEYTNKFGVAATAAIDEPAFSKDGMDCSYSDILAIPNLQFPNNRMFTVSVKTFTQDPTIPTPGSVQLLKVSNLFFINYSGTNVRFYVGGSVFRDFPRSNQQNSTLTTVFAGDVANFYQDGVLLGSLGMQSGMATTGDMGFSIGAKVINSIKMWHVNLSDRQVSTL